MTGLTSNPTLFEHALADEIQADARDSFVESWNVLLARIESKCKTRRAA